MAISMYSTPSCTYCKKAKQFFKENRIKFNDYNIMKDARRKDEMVRKSGQMGVPVIDINGQIIVGFDQQKIQQALRR